MCLFFFVHRLLSILSCPPFGKFPLAFLALIESENVQHDTAGNGFNLMLWNVGIVDELFSSTQVLSSV